LNRWDCIRTLSHFLIQFICIPLETLFTIMRSAGSFDLVLVAAVVEESLVTPGGFAEVCSRSGRSCGTQHAPLTL
jgi:hypothetical protein